MDFYGERWFPEQRLDPPWRDMTEEEIAYSESDEVKAVEAERAWIAKMWRTA